MTRQTVRNAYSDVRPTQEQKDKMWNAIMAEKDSRPLELRREKPAGGFRFSTIAASLGLVAMLAVVVWFGGSAVLKTKSSPAELTAMDAETNAAYMDQGVRAEAAESADDSAQSAAGDAEDALYRPVSGLSGGMKRRVAVARALAAPSDLLLMDEPFSGLDDDTRNRVIQVILRYRNGRTLLIVTHQEEDAAKLGGSILRLS